MNEQNLLIWWWVASFVNWFCIAWQSILTTKLRRPCLLHFSIMPFSSTCTSGHGLLNRLHLQAFLLFVTLDYVYFLPAPTLALSTFLILLTCQCWINETAIIVSLRVRWCLKVRAVFGFLSASSHRASEASAWENPWSLCMLGVSLSVCLGKFEWRETNDISCSLITDWHFKSSRGFRGSASYIVRWAAVGKSRILLRCLTICLWL